MNYIDQNPVAAKLVTDPAEWKASGAFYKLHGLTDLVDYFPHERQNYVKLIAPPPHSVSQLFPPAQLGICDGLIGDTFFREYAP